MSRRRLWWALLAATAANFALLAFWAAPLVRAGAGGARLFDERLAFSAAEAEAFLLALAPEAREIYLGPLRALDTAFPLLLGATLLFALLRLTRGLPRPVRILAAALPVAGALLDLRENALVAEMLRSRPQNLPPDLVAAASLATSGKWAADLLSGAAVVALLAGGRLRRTMVGAR